MAFYLSECIWDQYNGQTTMDHCVYVYVMKYICQIPILLTLECVEMGATTNHIIAICLKCIAKYGGILNEKFGSRWVCLGCGGDCVF
jgi:hypothetical protein